MSDATERADVQARDERDAFLRAVIAELQSENIRWPGLWTRLQSLLNERDSLAAALRAGDSREEWLTAQLDKQTANAGKLLAALREVEVRARDAYEMAKGWRCECLELGGGFVNKCRRCLLLDDLSVIRGRSAALAAASTEGADG